MFIYAPDTPYFVFVFECGWLLICSIYFFGFHNMVFYVGTFYNTVNIE